MKLFNYDDRKGVRAWAVIILSAIFAAQKLTGAFVWSWWWVFSPIIFAYAVDVFVFIVVCAVCEIIIGYGRRARGERGLRKLKSTILDDAAVRKN